MKYLIILLVSLNAFAEFKVNIINHRGQPMSKSGFDSEADAQKYIDKFKRKWGKDKGWYRTSCKNPIETRVIEFEGESITEYHCNATFSVEIKDITQEKRMENLEKAMSQNIKCGTEVKKFIGVLNITTAKTQDDIKKIMALKPELNNYLSGGAIDTARTEIQSIDLSETSLIDQAYKDAIIAKIDSCKFDWTSL